MPIDVDADVVVFSREKFHKLAEQVIGLSFDAHNEYGRLLDEVIYKNVLQQKCEAAGIVPARTEVKIQVSYQDFTKSYYMDLLCANGLMVEAKATESLTNIHELQALQYLLLCEMKHGLLINLRPGSVEKRFVSTTLNLNERRRYTVNDSRWHNANPPSQKLRELFLELLDDWGAFLQRSLYREALIHFFGGPDVALNRVPIYGSAGVVGSHEMFVLTADTAVAITTLKGNQDPFQQHLQRLLNHTKLARVQWINVHRHSVAFRTLDRRQAA